MKIVSITHELEYLENKPAVKLLLETAFTKEIRIAMRQDQVMKEHQTPFPIVVAIIEGKIEFGVKGETHLLQKGDIVALDGGIPHDLKAMADSVIRLTLSKPDQAARVKKVVD